MSGIKPFAFAALAVSAFGLAVSPCSAQFRRPSTNRPGTKPLVASHVPGPVHGTALPHPSALALNATQPDGSNAHQGFVTANVSRMTRPSGNFYSASPGDIVTPSAPVYPVYVSPPVTVSVDV
jgi:hypothetical protein